MWQTEFVATAGRFLAAARAVGLPAVPGGAAGGSPAEGVRAALRHVADELDVLRAGRADDPGVLEDELAVAERRLADLAGPAGRPGGQAG